MADPLNDDRAAPPPLHVRAAGVLLALAGTFTAVSGAQMFLLLWLRTWQKGVAGWLLLLGLLAIAAAPSLFKARAWAALTGNGLAVLMALTDLVWFVYMLTAFSFSLVVLIALAMSVLCLPLALLSIAPSFRVTAARRALYGSR